jgi:hypothetical protein
MCWQREESVHDYKHYFVAFIFSSFVWHVTEMVELKILAKRSLLSLQEHTNSPSFNPNSLSYILILSSGLYLSLQSGVFLSGFSFRI